MRWATTVWCGALWCATAQAEPQAAVALPAASTPVAEASARQTPTPSTTTAEFGKGLQAHSADGLFSVQMRVRAQLRYTATRDDEDDWPASEFLIRRMRLLFRGRFFHPTLDYYVQLGFAKDDTEPDLRLPLRDAYVTWSPLRDLGVRFGQMKVPFALQRRVSSGSLQFPDRSLVTSELNLDRDTGLVLGSNDLGGFDGLLGYQVGVFGGDGRNRSYGDPGVLGVARLQLKPLGAFDELIESDFGHSPKPRLLLAVNAAWNSGSRRAQSTLGTAFQQARFDYKHLGADALFKLRGLSLQAEWLWREADRDVSVVTQKDGSQLTERSRSAWGLYGQAGYAFSRRWEVVGRYGTMHPLHAVAAHAKDLRQQEAGVGVNWYGAGHDFKVQTDVFRLAGDDLGGAGEWQLRTQTQFWF
jgi:phosphate-selective porin